MDINVIFAALIFPKNDSKNNDISKERGAHPMG